MIFRQITHDDLGCASYLIGDEDAGLAAVVDPRFEIQEYLRLARYMGVRIEHILETHNHADHVSGHGPLHAATGAAIHIHHEALPEYEHEPFDDGWHLELGSVTVHALHTPGHRPEHTSFVLIDRARSDEPWAVLTGDSLFVGDVARPDLAIESSEGAREIFRSLRNRLLALPDHCEVWPGHLGGSMCGGPGMDMKVSSTIGYERRNSPLLTIEDEDEFVARSLADLGPQPPNFSEIVAINRGPLTGPRTEPPALAPGQVQSQREQGALIVDVRTDIQFDEAHIPGAVCIPTARAGFGTKLAWLADHEQPVVLIGRDGHEARVAGRYALAIGLTRLAGYLEGGMSSWREEVRPVTRLVRLDAGGLGGWRERNPRGQILDVREKDEWDECHIKDSIHMVWHDIEGLPPAIDPDLPVAVICASGERAATGASLISRLGAKQVVHVVEGGVNDAIDASDNILSSTAA